MSKLKLLIILLLAGIAPYGVQAQQVLYSGYDSYDFQTGTFSVVGKVGERLYVYRGSAIDGFYLDAYNDNMERTATVVLDFFPQKVYDTRFIAYADKIIVLYQAVEGAKVVMSAALLDEKGRLKKGPVIIDSDKTGLFNSTRDRFSSAVSENKENILVYSVNEKKKVLNVKCTWLDDSLKITQRHTATFEADNTISSGDGILSNSGTLFLPAYTPIGNKQYADQLWMLALKAGDRKFVPFELPLDAKYAGGTYMKMDEVNNRIYVGGFYADKKNSNYEGLLYTYFDIAKGSFENRKLIPIDEQIRMGAGDMNKRRAFNDYVVRQLIIKNDGGFVMMAENYFVTSRNNYPAGFGYYSWYYPTMATAITEYNYRDIFVMSYSAEGTLDWHTFIRKDQYSQEDGGLFSSYMTMNTGGAIGILFNDFNVSNSRIQLASIDGKGEVDIKPLTKLRNEDPDWLPRSGKQVSAREIVIPCLRRKQICFAKVVF